VSIRRSIMWAAWFAALVVVGSGGALGQSQVPAASLSVSTAPGGAAGAPDEVLPAGSCRAGVMSDSVCVTREIGSWRGVPFTPPVACSSGGTKTCRILMDVYAPTATGTWPLVVVVPGGPMPPDQVFGYADDFAQAIADRGAVVMTANWRQDASFGAEPAESPADVACAIGVARATGLAYGADPDRVVLVGHSNGARPVALVGLTPVPSAPDAASCDATRGSLRPDAIVVIAGLYSRDIEELAESDSPDEHIPVVVAVGGKDYGRASVARSFQDVLAAAGWDSDLVEVPTADHPGILYAPETIDSIMALAEAR
jgi:acetyl esterase/lipase